MFNFGSSQLILDYKMILVPKSEISTRIEKELSIFENSLHDKRDLYLNIYGNKGTLVYQLGNEVMEHIELQMALITNR